MTFDDVAAEIVKNSIRTAYAIDDEFVEPYTRQKGNREISKELYASFQKAGCSLEIARFRGKKTWENGQKENLRKKDLLILDWELNKGGVKFANTLRILQQAIQEPGLPFICIYTHSQDLDVIAQNIFSYFWYGNESQGEIDKKREDFLNELEDNVVDFDETTFKAIVSRILDIVKNPQREREVISEISNNITKKYGGKAIKSIIDAGKKILVMVELKDVFIYIALSSIGYFKSGKKFNKIEIISILTPACPYSLLINNALVQVFQKPGAAGSIPPEKLYESLSSAIYKRPNNFVSLLGLEFRNYFRDKSKNLGRELNSINEDAFLYHQECVKNDSAGEDHFSFFMKDIWNSQVTGDWHGHSPKTLAVIEDYKTSSKFDEKLAVIKQNKGESISEALAYLNKRYSMLRWEPNPPTSLRFGDIFKTNSQDIPYLLCITSHCDCLYPTKINDMILFVSGRTKNIRKGLESGDNGFQSFVRDEESKAICLDWDNKPFSIHIETSTLNLLKPVKAFYRSKQIELLYQCTQRENYTQRIANHAFGNAGRVGITFASLKEFKAEIAEPCKYPKKRSKCVE